jgi:hypothetical protein
MHPCDGREICTCVILKSITIQQNGFAKMPFSNEHTPLKCLLGLKYPHPSPSSPQRLSHLPPPLMHINQGQTGGLLATSFRHSHPGGLHPQWCAALLPQRSERWEVEVAPSRRRRKMGPQPRWLLYVRVPPRVRPRRHPIHPLRCRLPVHLAPHTTTDLTGGAWRGRGQGGRGATATWRRRLRLRT